MITTSSLIDSDTVRITTTPDPVSNDITVSGTNASRQEVQVRIAQKILNHANEALNDIAADLADLTSLNGDFATAIAAGATDPGTIILDTTGLQNDLAALIAKATTEAGGMQA